MAGSEQVDKVLSPPGRGGAVGHRAYLRCQRYRRRGRVPRRGAPSRHLCPRCRSGPRHDTWRAGATHRRRAARLPAGRARDSTRRPRRRLVPRSSSGDCLARAGERHRHPGAGRRAASRSRRPARWTSRTSGAIASAPSAFPEGLRHRGLGLGGAAGQGDQRLDPDRGHRQTGFFVEPGLPAVGRSGTRQPAAWWACRSPPTVGPRSGPPSSSPSARWHGSGPRSASAPPRRVHTATSRRSARRTRRSSSAARPSSSNW